VFLTFEVTSANAASLGSGRRKVFTVDGGRIGRSADNDMVLPGVGVHRHHATVRFINGVFFVEGVGTNGIAINNPEVVLPRNEPYPLKTGDKVFIDEYEVAVTASATAPAEAAAPGAPRSSRAGVDSTGPSGQSHASQLGSFPGALDDAPEDLDPLRQLLGGAPSPSTPQQRSRAPADASWNHSSSLSDHFAPPPVAPAPAGAAAPVNVIPENWDRTTFDRSKLQPPPPAPQSQVYPQAPPHAPPQSPGHAQTPQRPSQSLGQPQSPGRPQMPTHAPQSQGEPRAPQSNARPQAPSPPLPQARPQHAPPGAAPASPVQGAGAAPHAPAAAATPRSAGAALFDWDAFLKAANVDPSRVPPETAAILGNILRSVVQGLIEVLRARSEIKTEFRMPVTQVKVSENNPLKFAANAEDALGNLLGRRNSAYLPPQEAFEDAFNDVRFHQLAMLAGVRAGFDNLLNRFDPASLQESFERTGKRGLFGGGKASYWERYAERFQELSADRDETFRRLFGEEFARAYEQQLSALKHGRKDTP
jgi:type VI secretion system FHA domain protein